MSEDLRYLEGRKVLPNQKLLDIAKRDERRLLSLIIRHEKFMRDAVNSKISFKHFLVEQHAHFYGFIADFFQHHGVLATEQSFRTRLEELFDDEVTVSSLIISFQKHYHAHVDEHEYAPLKEGLLNRYVQQQFYEISQGGQRIVDMIESTSGQREALSTLISDLERINTGREAEQHIRTSTAAETAERVIQSIRDRRENPEIAYGIETGYASIDSRFLGFEPGKYLIILGPPHGCKTTLMLNMAYGMAKTGKTVIFVTMESTDEEIMERLIAIESGVYSIEIKDGNILKNDPQKMSAIESAAKRVKDVVGEKFIFISVPQQTSWTTIKGLIEDVRQFHPVDAFWVDYLDVIEREKEIHGRADLELADISINIQAYAKNTGMFGATAQSLNNEKIKELKKQNAFEKPDEAAALAGGEGVGGSQKLWRDADYMLTSLPFKKGKRITIVITKARKDGNSEDMFYLAWEPRTGLIFEYESSYYVVDSVQKECKGMILDEPPEVEIKEKIRIGKNGEEIVTKVESSAETKDEKGGMCNYPTPILKEKTVKKETQNDSNTDSEFVEIFKKSQRN